LDDARRSYWNIDGKAGGDINIHGCCISIGCIPLGNPAIEEVFFLTRTNQKKGSQINIMIFPFKFDDKTARIRHYGNHSHNTKLLEFWNSLEACHKYFKTTHMMPEFNPDENRGYYILNGT
jgi:murein L,D-transpeptidase YafK